MQRWSFTVQRSLIRRMMVELGYMGNRGTGQGLTDDLDAVPSQYLSRSPVRDTATINALGALVANPFQNLLPGTSINGSTIAASNLLRPFPEFTGVTMNDIQFTVMLDT